MHTSHGRQPILCGAKKKAARPTCHQRQLGGARNGLPRPRQPHQHGCKLLLLARAPRAGLLCHRCCSWRRKRCPAADPLLHPAAPHAAGGGAAQRARRSECAAAILARSHTRKRGQVGDCKRANRGDRGRARSGLSSPQRRCQLIGQLGLWLRCHGAPRWRGAATLGPRCSGPARVARRLGLWASCSRRPWRSPRCSCTLRLLPAVTGQSTVGSRDGRCVHCQWRAAPTAGGS